MHKLVSLLLGVVLLGSVSPVLGAQRFNRAKDAATSQANFIARQRRERYNFQTDQYVVVDQDFGRIFNIHGPVDIVIQRVVPSENGGFVRITHERASGKWTAESEDSNQVEFHWYNDSGDTQGQPFWFQGDSSG